ncbi:YrbL family protein [Vibrio sp. 1S139]|uniref:YrbL family protein n=1 Tax=Vibrio sp. 1S139 TaxID=3230006 RepID=UPI00352FD256
MQDFLNWPVIGRGSERTCYLDPKDPNRCIKVSHRDKSKQTKREVAYLEKLKKNNIDFTHLPQYYGVIDCGDYIGIIQEVVRNDNGDIASDLRHYLKRNRSEKELSFLQDGLNELKGYLKENNIIPSDLVLSNILVLEKKESIKLVLIDGYGSTELFPLSNYLPLVGRRKIERKWNKFKTSKLPKLDKIEIQVNVISLLESKKRRANVDAQFSGKLKYSYFDAYKFNDIPKIFASKIDDRKTIFRRGYALGRGERGCFYSHYALWHKCVSDNVPMIILEDDIVIKEDFFDLIKSNKLDDQEYVKLEKRSSSLINFGDFFFPTQNRSGAVGYYLSPIGAKKLIDNSHVVYMPVDHYIGAVWLHGIPPLCLKKPVITHHYEMGTNIQSERKILENDRSYSIFSRLLRKFIRLKENCMYRLVSIKKFYLLKCG